LDDDDDVDILGTDGIDNDIIWFKNNGSGNFTEDTIADDFVGVCSVYACDLDDDDDVDVLGAGVNEIAWWESDLKDTYDAGLISIDVPSSVPEDTTFAPVATAKNFGSMTVTFPITCKIEPGAYMKTQTVHDLAPGESLQVTFATSFTFASGSYTVTVYTRLTDDDIPANDTLVKVVETHDPGIVEDGVVERFGFRAPAITRGRMAIELSLVQATGVELLVYDVLGRQCQTLIDQPLGSGVHSFQLDLDLAAGIYFFHLKTGSGERVVQKFTLLR
jgi:hypothetical protein